MNIVKTTNELNRSDYLVGIEEQKEQVINDRIVEGFLGQLLDTELIGHAPKVDWESFRSWEKKITSNFDVPVSSVTTRMARVFFALAYIEKPQTIACIGSAWGNALIWLSSGAPKAQCFGIDINMNLCEIARQNFSSISCKATFLAKDGREVAEFLPEIDLLLLDADDPVFGKKVLIPIIKSLRGNLSNNSLVLAHDAALMKFQEDFKEYRDTLCKLGFRKTMTLEIDRCGLEVSRL